MEWYVKINGLPYLPRDWQVKELKRVEETRKYSDSLRVDESGKIYFLGHDRQKAYLYYVNAEPEPEIKMETLYKIIPFRPPTTHESAWKIYKPFVININMLPFDPDDIFTLPPTLRELYQRLTRPLPLGSGTKGSRECYLTIRAGIMDDKSCGLHTDAGSQGGKGNQYFTSWGGCGGNKMENGEYVMTTLEGSFVILNKNVISNNHKGSLSGKGHLQLAKEGFEYYYPNAGQWLCIGDRQLHSKIQCPGEWRLFIRIVMGKQKDVSSAIAPGLKIHLANHHMMNPLCPHLPIVEKFVAGSKFISPIVYAEKRLFLGWLVVFSKLNINIVDIVLTKLIRQGSFDLVEVTRDEAWRMSQKPTIKKQWVMPPSKIEILRKIIQEKKWYLLKVQGIQTYEYEYKEQFPLRDWQMETLRNWMANRKTHFDSRSFIISGETKGMVLVF